MADRLAEALTPTVTAKDCDGFYDEGHGGAFYRWCLNVLNQAVDRRAKEGLLGLSYGIFTWDSWSRYMSNDFGVDTVLHDCFATTPFEGIHANYTVPYLRKDVCISGNGMSPLPGDSKRFESFNTHLAPRPSRGTFVKIDIEGSEWDILKNITDEELQKIDLLDMEIHMCHIPWAAPEGDANAGEGINVWQSTAADKRMALLRDRVETVERLLKVFSVTGRDPADHSDPNVGESNAEANYYGHTDEEICGTVNYPKKGCQGMFSISFVNKRRLAEAQRGPKHVRQGPKKLRMSQSFIDA